MQQQLQTGTIDMPSMVSTIKDSGAVNFALEDGETNETVETNGSETMPSLRMGIEQSVLPLTLISIHNQAEETSETRP